MSSEEDEYPMAAKRMATAGSKAGKPDDGAGIQSVEVAARILRALADGGGALYLRELAAAAGMPRAKVHRYLKSLARTEFVVQEAETGRYYIGPAAISVGLTGLNRISPVRLAYSMLPELCAQLGETVFVAVWGDRGPTIVALEEPIGAVTINLRVGSSLPLLDSAMGRVFAAFLPRQKTADAMKAAVKAGRLKAADALLAEIRHDGLAPIEGTLLPGINALAAPVFNHHDHLAFVIGAVGRMEALDVSLDGEAARLLREAARKLSERLGYDARQVAGEGRAADAIGSR